MTATCTICRLKPAQPLTEPPVCSDCRGLSDFVQDYENPPVTESERWELERERLLDINAKLLAALQRMGRNPPPVIVTRREDALAMVRSAMLIATTFPEMRTQALASESLFKRNRHNGFQGDGKTDR